MPELLAPIRIAMIDSQPIMRDALRQLLEQEQDFQVVAEAGDAEAMEAVHECKPDLLLLEVADPRGFSVLERMQDASPKIRTIVLTADDQDFTIVRAMRHGARGIVFKSMEPQQLMDAIRKVHDGGVWLDARCQAAVMGEVRSPERDPLTRREHQVVDLVARGYRNRDIAAALSITHHTVSSHIHRVFRKLNVSDRIQLTLYKIQGYPFYRHSEAGVQA